MFGHDARHSGRGSAEGPVIKPQVAWRAPTIRGARASFSSAAVSANGVVYSSTLDGCTFAYAGDTGAVRWSHCDNDGPIYSSPALSHNGVRVYVASLGGKSLLSLNATDGSLLWKYPLGDAVTGSPSVSYAGDGTVFIGSYDGGLYSIHSGVLSWRCPIGDLIISTAALDIRSEDNFTPLGALYVASTAGSLFALNATSGAELWRTSAWGAGGPFDLGLQSSPTLSDDASRIYIGTWDGALLCFAANNGAVLWRFNASTQLHIPAPAIIATPALSPAGWGRADLVYAGTAYQDAATSAAHGTLFAVHAETGELAWATPVGCDIITAPAVGSSGVLFVSIDDAEVVDTRLGGVAAYDGAKGSLLWTLPLGEAAMAPPAMGADGTLYVGGAAGAFYALAAPSVAPSVLPSALPSPPAAPTASGLSTAAVAGLCVLGGVALAAVALAAVFCASTGWRNLKTGSRGQGLVDEGYASLNA